MILAPRSLRFFGLNTIPLVLGKECIWFVFKCNLLADCVIYLQDSLHQQYANADDEITMATRMLREATPCVDKSDRDILEDIKYISRVRFSLTVVAKYIHKFYGTPQASIPDAITQGLFAAASKLCDQLKSQWPRYISYLHINISFRGCHGRDRMIVEIKTTYAIAISAYWTPLHVDK